MSDSSFFFQNLSSSDEEFWQQLKDLDAMQEELPDFYGFAIKAKLPDGKDVNVPFVRFRNALPKKAS